MISLDEARLVVTGFGPFGDHDYNPSTDAARSLAQSVGTDAHLLPVDYTEVAPFGRAHLRAHTEDPLVFVHLGLGARRSKVCFETRARNRRDDRPDERERDRHIDPDDHRRLVDEPADGYATGLDLPSLLEDFNRLRSDDLPEARLSDDCGSYVCNALYYHSLRACRRHRRSSHPADAIFVHIPHTDSEDARRTGRLLARIFS